MSAKTKAVQQAEVAAGLALGVLEEGVAAITSGKMSVEFAFRPAWRRWQDTRSYPQVRADVMRDDIYYQVIGRSERRRFSYAAWRTDGPHLVPYVSMDAWTVGESLDALAESSGVARTSWQQLARLFLAGLKPAEKFTYEDD